jgi:hypothetical protein
VVTHNAVYVQELHTNMEYEEQEDEFDLNERSTAAPEDATDDQPLRAKVDVVKRSAADDSEAADSESLLFLIGVSRLRVTSLVCAGGHAKEQPRGVPGLQGSHQQGHLVTGSSKQASWSSWC